MASFHREGKEKKTKEKERKMEETSLLQYHVNHHRATWSCTQALSFHGLGVAALAWSRRVFRVQRKRSTGNLQAGVCSGTVHPGCNPDRPLVLRRVPRVSLRADMGSRRSARSTLRYRAGTGGACLRAGAPVAAAWAWSEHVIEGGARGSSSVPTTWVAREVELSGQAHVDMKCQYAMMDSYARSLASGCLSQLKSRNNKNESPLRWSPIYKKFHETRCRLASGRPILLGPTT